MEKSVFSVVLTGLMLFSASLSAEVYYVDDVPTNGNGTQASPFNTLNNAVDAAQAGDMIYVLPGTYNESILTKRDGTTSQRITINAYDVNNRPVITYAGEVLGVDHAYVTIEGFIFDGQFGSGDVVKIKEGGDYTIIRDCEIKNGVKDGIDLNQADNVLIEDCEIHHFLGGTISNQVDAHGIVATGETNLTIRGCNIYYNSGDCFQTDPNRGYPLWDNVLIESCKLWTGPLPANAAGWNAGEIPGENGIDTKINGDAVNTSYRPKIILKKVEAYGFVEGYINNRAAFNIKEKVDCEVIAGKVYNNEIGFRLRGPGSRGGAYITVINTIAYDNEKTLRIEDGVEYLHIYNSTFDKGNGNEYIQAVSGGYDPNGFDLRNCLFNGTKPADASNPSNLSANSSFFVNMAAHNYRLSSTSPAIDAGDDIAEVTDDYDGNPRYIGSYDVGAFEYGSPSGIDDPDETDVKIFYLYPNYPNPFNPTTHIIFNTGRLAAVHLDVYDIVGNLIRTLVNEILPAGQHHLQWDGRDAKGIPVASGIYFYRLEVDHSSQTRKMHLLR